MRRTDCLLGTLALGFLLFLTPGDARAQPGQPDPNAAAPGEESKGDPWFGYVGTAALAGLALFVVGKSARR
jgi:hypothetical protein